MATGIPFDDQQHVLRPIVKGWVTKIDRAKEQKKPFQDIADECRKFFSAEAGWMWSKKNRSKFFDSEIGQISPRFQMTVAKAFELVALFGPVLYHRNPIRTVTPRKPLEIDPTIFGAFPGSGPPMMTPMGPQPGVDPMAMMLFQQAQQEEMLQSSGDRIRADLLSRILNFTPNEMPGGGLQQHAERAITEALVTGLGCIWTEVWNPPGSDKKLIIQRQDSVDNIFVDPDAETWEDAWWIAQKCIHPIWEVERNYPWLQGKLEGRGTLESANSQSELSTDDMGDIHRRQGKTNDLLVYWKIWSKMGIGARLTGVKTDLKDALDLVCGDYCYLAVSRDIPFPLNFPTEMLMQSTDEEIRKAVEWPIPYWADNRWPVTMLSFYDEPGNIWPIAPLKPGLGELKFLNTMISHLANRIWTSSRDFIAFAKSAGEDLKAAFQHGKDQTFLEIEQVQGDIGKVVQFLQQPQTNLDVWRILEAVMELFDKRVGLTELLYGLNPGGTQPRSASEMQVKQASVSVRPDYMAGKVEQWMTEAARREGMAWRFFGEPQDVAPMIGNVGAYLWQQYVMNTDVETVVRELEYRVEANSARKPDKNRQVANVQEAMPMWLPVLQAYAQGTGNTNPINAMMVKWGKAVDEDVSDMLLPPMPPPPPPGMEQPGSPKPSGNGKPKNRVGAT